MALRNGRTPTARAARAVLIPRRPGRTRTLGDYSGRAWVTKRIQREEDQSAVIVRPPRAGRLAGRVVPDVLAKCMGGLVMRTGTARGQAGYVHEAGFYGSDAEFRALIVPFAEEGIAAGEPVIIGYDDRKSDLLRSWLSDPSAVEFLGDKSLYATPARTIATYRQLFEFHVAMGAEQIRIAGDVPHRGNGGRFEGWDRYESAINTVWQDFPVWALCLYDTATTSAAVLDIVERTHPHIVSPSGARRASTRYQDALAFEGLPYAPDPLEDTPPVAELVNRSAAEARRALTQAGRGRVPDTVLQDLLIGATEAITNAQRHGRPPVTVRIWTAPDRVVVTVHDTGQGPADRMAGLIPAPDSTSDRRLGMGLWVMHQLDLDVALRHAGAGFTVRLRHLPASA
jgi:anti-sigma regulatory factor (Ser/Thr protein kinase)